MGWAKCSEDNWDAFYERMEMREKFYTNTEERYEKNTKTIKNEVVILQSALVSNVFCSEKG